jgi:hypothetical protein
LICQNATIWVGFAKCAGCDRLTCALAAANRWQPPLVRDPLSAVPGLRWPTGRASRPWGGVSYYEADRLMMSCQPAGHDLERQAWPAASSRMTADLRNGPPKRGGTGLLRVSPSSQARTQPTSATSDAGNRTPTRRTSGQVIGLSPRPLRLYVGRVVRRRPTVGIGITAARRLLRPVIAVWWCGGVFAAQRSRLVDLRSSPMQCRRLSIVLP